MLGTRQFTNLLKAVQAGGGMLVSVGDPKQLQAIEAGGPFGSLLTHHTHVELKEITRQKDIRNKETVHDFAEGRATKALKGLAERGFLTVADGRGKAIEQLVTDWFHNERSHTAQSLIFCGQTTKPERLTVSARGNGLEPEI